MQKRILTLLVITVCLFSCSKKKTVGNVPYTPFNTVININLPSYASLEGVSGWAYAPGGSKGIIVYRKSTDTFIAFDRQSTADDGLNCGPIISDTSNFIVLKDTCGTSEFSLVDGSVLHGPAQYGLRAYKATFDGVYTVTVSN